MSGPEQKRVNWYTVVNLGELITKTASSVKLAPDQDRRDAQEAILDLITMIQVELGPRRP